MIADTEAAAPSCERAAVAQPSALAESTPRQPLADGPGSTAAAVTQHDEAEQLPSDTARLEAARARAARRGIRLASLVTGAGGRPEYIATFHTLSRSFAGLAELEAWLDRVAGVQT